MGRFRPALELALAQFLASAEWPERERFRRTLVQRGLDKLNLDELLRDMPRSSWPTRQIPPDRVVLSFQVLQELPGAADLLNVCVAVIQRAYALYCSEADDPVLDSHDAVLTAASHDDARLLLCARELLTQHPPGPLGGGTAGTGSTEWTRTLNEAAIPAFNGAVEVGQGLVIAFHRLVGPAATGDGPRVAGVQVDGAGAVGQGLVIAFHRLARPAAMPGLRHDATPHIVPMYRFDILGDGLP